MITDLLGTDTEATDAELTALAMRVHRALVRRTGCRLTPAMVQTLDRLEATGAWWERMRLVTAPAALPPPPRRMPSADFDTLGI
ncbi:hypothetical protein FHS96_005615 [Sphingomonas zeicaulis]|uniref:hypothetical protein n=1 Tax=Sphingomonas zeicaulis TaxID=1632740 RepID=UPI003D21E235